MTTRGEAAELLVVDRLRAVLPPDFELLHSVHWLAGDHGAAAKGEADVVIGDPQRGILVLEVKAGEIRRDDHGTWWAGPHELPRPPFQRAADNRYALVRKLQELPDWPAQLKPIAGEAVALPDVDLDSMRGRLGLIGLDAEQELIADQSSFADDVDGRRELRAFIDRAFSFWSAPRHTCGPRSAPTGRGLALRSRDRSPRPPVARPSPDTVGERAWTSIDTHDRTWHRPTMTSKVKRTYNLAPETVRRVRELAEGYAVAPSQDAVIELAIDELDRRLLEQREADQWAQAASDPDYQRDVAAIEAAYGSADGETWPR